MSQLCAPTSSASTSRAGRWRALVISLRGLGHPLTLGSIALLLLNDHVLKAAAPSTLTGKLSDLAGLFFFPFLLATLLSLPLDRLRVPPRHVAALAFGITLAWFALIKTVPEANALTAAALSRVLGFPVQIILDPTDLLALVALVPAWLLWVRLERTPAPRRLRPADLLALGLAALATVATPPCPPPPRVARLVVHEGSIYAGITRGAAEWKPAIVRSDDGGRTWPWLSPYEPIVVPDEVARQFEQPAQLPVVVCDPRNPQVCYRITGAEQVEGSSDGGKTWRVVWQVPWGRRQFMEMAIARRAMWCKFSLDLGPYDLALLPQKDGTALVAAMGSEGVLIRTPDGAWRQYAVLDAQPTPLASLDPSILMWLLPGESGIVLGAAVLAWLVLCILGWQVILSRIRSPARHSAWWAIAPVILAAISLLLTWLLAYWLIMIRFWDGPQILLSPLAVILMAAVFVFVAPVLTWRRVKSMSPQPNIACRAALVCFLAALGIFPLAWLPFPLWACGVIPVYEFALALSVLIGLVVFIWGVWLVRRLSRRAVLPTFPQV